MYCNIIHREKLYFYSLFSLEAFDKKMRKLSQTCAAKLISLSIRRQFDKYPGNRYDFASGLSFANEKRNLEQGKGAERPNLLRHVAQPNLALSARVIYCSPSSRPFNPRYSGYSREREHVRLPPSCPPLKIIISFTLTPYFAEKC